MPYKVKGDDPEKKEHSGPLGWGWDMGLAIPPHKNVLMRRHFKEEASSTKDCDARRRRKRKRRRTRKIRRSHSILSRRYK